MEEFVTKINEETGKPEVEIYKTISRFVYESGYTLEGVDLGMYLGAKLTLTHSQYEEATILLTPEIVDKLAKWLMNTLGQTIPLLPVKLPKILERITKTKGMNIKLQGGDKKALKSALDLIKRYEDIKVEQQNQDEGKDAD